MQGRITVTGEDVLRALVARAPVAMGINDLDGRFILVNRACAEFFGRSEDELLAMRWQELTWDGGLEEEVELVSAMMSGAIDSYRLTKPFRSAQGTLRWGDLSVSCVRDDEGTCELIIGQIIDVTEAEESRRTLASTLSSMLDPHVLFDVVRDDQGVVVDEIYREVSDAAVAYLGRSRDELIGRRASDVISPEGAAEVAAWLGRTLAEGRLDLDDEVMRGSIRGADQRYEIRAVPVGDSVSFTWRNITARMSEVDQVAQRERQYRLLAENISDVIIRSGIDSRIEYVSPSVVSLGWSVEELQGRAMVELIHPDDLGAVRVAMGEALSTGKDEGRAEARFATKDGGWRWMGIHGRVVRDADGQVLGGIDSLRDIQSEHDARAAREAQNDVMRGVIDSLIDPWILLTAVRDTAGHIVDFIYVDANDAACLHNGIDRSDLVGARLLHVVPEHGPSGIFDRYARVVETGEPLVEDEVPFTHPVTGHVGWYDNRAVKVADGISLTWRDVTDRYLMRRSLEQQAEHDLLTGVANRRQLERRLGQLATGERRTGELVAVLYLDLDNFKDINDTLGHAAGDGVLTTVAARIRRALRDSDMVARLGGDEFVVILDGVKSRQDAFATGEKVAAAIRRPVRVGDAEVTPRASIGVAVVDPDQEPAGALGAADLAMYEAKRQGRDRVVMAEER